MRRWLVAGALAAAGTISLLWAFPRVHPAAEWHWTADRSELIEKAREFARDHGVDTSGSKPYVLPHAETNNLLAQRANPRDPILQTFPITTVQVALVPKDGPAATMTFRPDGRPIAWKLPPATRSGPSGDPRHVAEAALLESTGGDAHNFRLASNGASSRDGVRFAWEWPGLTGGAQSKGEALVGNGFAREFENKMSLSKGEEKRLNGFEAIRVTTEVLWFLAIASALIFSLLRDGARVAARALREWAIVRLACAVVVLMLAGLFLGPGFDVAEFSSAFKPGQNLTVSLIVGGLVTGLTIYALLAGSLVNARFHPGRLRGLALLGTKALFSRPVGEGVLGGLLLGPALAAVPLVAGAIFGLKQSQGADADDLFTGWPVLANFAQPLNAHILGMFGIMVPLAIRWFKRPVVRYIFIGAIALLMGQNEFGVFRDRLVANEVGAVIGMALLLWLYSQFGVLGALMGLLSSGAITSAGVFLAQPAAGLHTGGIRIILTLSAIGVAGLIAWRFEAEPGVEVYGLNGLRVQARSRREELQAEFQVARSAQQQMLPSTPPSWPGYSLAASCEPAREVGGDLYDFLHLPDGRWGIGVADVSGKGVPAALYMTLTKGLLAAATQDSNDPREILISVNRHLNSAARRKVFVTMALGILDPEANSVEYVRAGHNPVVWRRALAKETRLLACPGLGLGIAGNSIFQKTITAEQIVLEPGDALVFYSDGLTEAMDDRREQFGEERLIAAIERCDGMAAEQARQGILEDVRVFLRGMHPQDDLTIAVLRFEGDSKSNSNGR